MVLAPEEGTAVSNAFTYSAWCDTAGLLRRNAVRLFLTALFVSPWLRADSAPSLDFCLIVGASGEAAYEEPFAKAAEAWSQAARQGGARVSVIGRESSDGRDDRNRVQEWIAGRSGDDQTPLWIVYLGHGSYDGRDARLNLRGPDLTASELAAWLDPLQRPVVFVHGGSASAPFLARLSRPGRIVVTATRSGHEMNYARFGEHLARSIADPAADIDRDGQTSLLEAFVTASRTVRMFYDENTRLVTEHALIDDNGDGHGTPAEWFRGTRVVRDPDGAHEPDGDRARLIALVPTDSERQLTAEQREQRDRLEHDLASLRQRKASMAPDVYDAALERILRQLAMVYGTDS